MAELVRLWPVESGEIASILGRPRTSMELDRYVWSYVDEKIVQPKRIMQSDKWVYKLVICFSKYDASKHKFFPDHEYNPNFGHNKPNQNNYVEFKPGDTDRLFGPEKFWILEKNIKASHISICSPWADADITPGQYADLLFDGFGSFLVYNFKKVKKAELDEIKAGLSKDVINSFRFPAPFEKQEYMLDDGTIRFTAHIGTPEATMESYNVKEYYEKHFLL